MSQFYTNPVRETEETALPDAEVFYVDAHDLQYRDDEGKCLEKGWYWWACFPGCLPDGAPNGPFDTEDEAVKDAQDDGETGWEKLSVDLCINEDLHEP